MPRIIQETRQIGRLLPERCNYGLRKSECRGLIEDVKYWRDRADEMRTEAEFTLQPITRTALLETAQGYEALVARVTRTEGTIFSA